MYRIIALPLLTELGPVIAFFIAVRVLDFFGATVILLGATVLATVFGAVMDRRIPLLPLIGSAFVIVSGGITLIYREPDALIFADTLYFYALAAIVGGGLINGRLFLKRIFAVTFAITDEAWRMLSWRWMIIFILAGSANEIARHTLTPEAWVDFKFIKTIVITLFALYQFRLVRANRIEELSNTWGVRRTPRTNQKTDTSDQCQ